MAGSYRQCDACGKRALSIAIRCPGCGREFPARAVPKDGGLELERFLTPKVVATVAVVAVLVSANVALIGQPAEEKAEVGTSITSTGPVETARVAALPAGHPGEEKPKLEPSIARTGQPARARVAALPARGGSELRVARSLTDVRKARSVRSPLEAVLSPGDTVLADSLEQGWYRVVLEGEVLGYAHRSKLLIPSAAATSSRAQQ